VNVSGQKPRTSDNSICPLPEEPAWFLPASPYMARRVLVAEDDRAIQSVVSEYLRDEGFEVDIANNGAEALLRARQTPPDMAVVDVCMPVMDGPALLATWTRDPMLHQVPVVMVSAAPGLADLARQFDVRATLAKPFDLHVLGALVRQVLAYPGDRPHPPGATA